MGFISFKHKYCKIIFNQHKCTQEFSIHTQTRVNPDACLVGRQ